MYRNDLIVEAMKALGKTNESLAYEAGLTAATISAARNGKESVGLRSLQAIAKELGLNMKDLFEPLEPKRARRGTSTVAT